VPSFDSMGSAIVSSTFAGCGQGRGGEVHPLFGPLYVAHSDRKRHL
jgi:hypothetical protein